MSTCCNSRQCASLTRVILGVGTCQCQYTCMQWHPVSLIDSHKYIDPHSHKRGSPNSLLLYVLLMMRELVCFEVHWFNYICIWYYLGISLWFFWGLCQNLAKNVEPLRKDSSWEISALKAWLSIGTENEERGKQQKSEWWDSQSHATLLRGK